MKDEWYRAWRAEELRRTPEQRKADHWRDGAVGIAAFAIAAYLLAITIF